VVRALMSAAQTKDILMACATFMTALDKWPSEANELFSWNACCTAQAQDRNIIRKMVKVHTHCERVE